MQVFSGIYLNFAGPAAVVEKTVFPEMFVGRFSERWFAILAFCAPRAVASMTAACALPRSSDAALAAYERGGVHGIVVALGLQSNSGLRLREQPVSRLTGGRLLAASVGGDGERRGSEGPAVSDLRSGAAASSAQMMDCITECSWPPQIPPSPASSARLGSHLCLQLRKVRCPSRCISSCSPPSQAVWPCCTSARGLSEGP